MTIWTISSVRSALAAKKLSARELATEFFTRIDAQNPYPQRLSDPIA